MANLRVNGKSFNRKILFYVFVALLSTWGLYILSTQLLPELRVRFIFDPADYRVYFVRGQWIIDHTVPSSEYPQIPTYLFGLNHLFSMNFNPDLQLLIYISIMSLEMTLVLYLTIQMLMEMLPEDEKQLALLMLLPTTLWFVFNRFDILPAFLSLLAFYFLAKKRTSISLVILAVSTFTKWYPALMLPGFLLFVFTKDRKLPLRGILVYVITSLAIIAPTYFQGGVDAVFAPYKFHTQRGMEYFSFAVLTNSLITAVFPEFNSQMLFPLFFVLQIIVSLLSPFIKFVRIENVLDYSILAISTFILFSRIDSPQWIIWLLPFLILAVKEKKDIWLIIVYSTVTYVAFPFAFDYFGPESIEFKLANTLIYIILFGIIFRTIKRLHFSLDFFRHIKSEKRMEQMT